VLYAVQNNIRTLADYLRYSEQGTTLVTILTRGLPIRVVSVTMET